MNAIIRGLAVIASASGSGSPRAHGADAVRLVHQVVQRELHELPGSAVDRLQGDDLAVLPCLCRRPAGLEAGVDLQPGKQGGQPGAQPPGGGLLELLGLAGRDLQLDGPERGSDDSVVKTPICLLSMNIGASASQDRSGTLSLTDTSIVLCVVDGVSNYVQLVKDS